MFDISRLFPKIGSDIHIPRVAFYFLVITAVISTGRSLVHIFAPDGGAYTIAGISVDTAGGANIIAIFAQWGVVQLLLALIYWLVILRYRFLTSAMLLVVVLEQVLRIGAGFIKPVAVTAPPPGAVGSYILLPLSVIALLISLYRKPGARRLSR